MQPWWWLGWALACGVAAGRSAFNGGADRTVRNVAIVGAGPAGSSAAYHLQRYAEEEGLAVNITVFEKTDRIGGRTLTVDVFDDPELPVELGASIFVTVNHILYNATKNFGLPLSDEAGASAGGTWAIWDGSQIVYESAEDSWWLWDQLRLLWRYGLTPIRAVQLVKGVVVTFLKLYEAPYFPFTSLTQRASELGLQRITGKTGEQFLADNKIRHNFARDIMQATTRVNYASNLAFIHALDTMVSFATDGSVAVEGGNWQIFDQMVLRSRAALYRNTTVTSIVRDKRETTPGAFPRYLISAQHADAAQAEEVSTAFDEVVVASPWQFSGIDAGEGVVKHRIEEVPYTKLHVTLFSSPLELRAEYFGLKADSKAPSTVYTTLSKDEEPRQGAEGVGSPGFYSIGTVARVTNPRTGGPEFVYKIFSATAVTPGFLSEILGVEVPDTFVTPAGAASGSGVELISWFYPHWFHSYPMALPRTAFQDPVVGRGVYYTSGMETFISTMETSALMGMNVARLIADGIAGTSRGGRLRAQGGAVPREDFFESLDSEMGASLGMPGADEL